VAAQTPIIPLPSPPANKQLVEISSAKVSMFLLANPLLEGSLITEVGNPGIGKKLMISKIGPILMKKG